MYGFIFQHCTGKDAANSQDSERDAKGEMLIKDDTNISVKRRTVQIDNTRHNWNLSFTVGGKKGSEPSNELQLCLGLGLMNTSEL